MARVLNFFYKKGRDNSRSNFESSKLHGYKSCVENILFEGNFLNRKAYSLIISQTNRESLLLDKGMLFADVYFPEKNWVVPILGEYSKDRLDAYSIGMGYNFNLKVPFYLRDLLLSKEIEGKNFPGRFNGFQDVFDFLKRYPKYSYHAKKEGEGNFWMGKSIYYGIPRVDSPIDFQSLEGELQLFKK